MNNLRVIKGDYNEYVKWNGLRLADDEFALNIKDGKTKYYIVLDDEKFFSDFFLFTDEMDVNLNIVGRFDEIAKVMIETLKEDYDVLTFTSDENTYNNFQYMKDYVEVLSEDEDVFNLADGRVFNIKHFKCKLK